MRRFIEKKDLNKNQLEFRREFNSFMMNRPPQTETKVNQSLLYYQNEGLRNELKKNRNKSLSRNDSENMEGKNSKTGFIPFLNERDHLGKLIRQTIDFTSHHNNPIENQKNL